MIAKTVCPRCGSERLANAPEGHCPRCLLSLGFLIEIQRGMGQGSSDENLLPAKACRRKRSEGEITGIELEQGYPGSLRRSRIPSGRCRGCF